jgi:hypothetical protein
MKFLKLLIIAPFVLIFVFAGYLVFFNLINQPIPEIKQEAYTANFEFVDLEIQDTITTTHCGREGSSKSYSYTNKTHYLNGVTIEKHIASENDIIY